MSPAVARKSGFEPRARPCTGCAGDTLELGELCAVCRGNQTAEVSPSFVQSTIADAARRLERLRPSDAPEHIRLPLAQALSDIRRAYDSIEPLIQTFQLGVIARNAVGYFFAHPYGGTEAMGPFGKRRHAERALIEHALHVTDWEADE